MQSLFDCNSTLFCCLPLPATFRTEEDRWVELCYWTGRGQCSREAGHRLETHHRCGRGDGHRRHHQLPHSDFPRVASGQRLLQRLGPGGLNGVKWGSVGGEGRARRERVGGAGLSVCDLWLRVSIGVSFPLCNLSLCSSTWQILPVWSVVRLHAQSWKNYLFRLSCSRAPLIHRGAHFGCDFFE